jgi:hypothetical protein
MFKIDFLIWIHECIRDSVSSQEILTERFSFRKSSSNFFAFSQFTLLMQYFIKGGLISP